MSYFLGLTPIQLAAYLLGTAAGRGFWSILYAAIGAYSRSYLRRGIGFDGLLTGAAAPPPPPPCSRVRLPRLAPIAFTPSCNLPCGRWFDGAPLLERKGRQQNHQCMVLARR